MSGRFGGGFSGFRTDRAGVISRLGMLKSYDCGQEPASVIVPESLKPEFQKVFPKSSGVIGSPHNPNIAGEEHTPAPWTVDADLIIGPHYSDSLTEIKEACQLAHSIIHAALDKAEGR